MEDSAMASRDPAQRLPPELMHHVLWYLDIEPYLQQRLYKNPATTLDKQGTSTGPDVKHDLKNASLVTHKWRHMIFPVLFRHLQWKVEKPTGSSTVQKPLLDFVQTRDVKYMGAIVQGLSIVFAENPWAPCSSEPVDRFTDEEKATFWSAVFSVIDPVRVTILGKPEVFHFIFGQPLAGSSNLFFVMPYHIIHLSRPSRTFPGELSREASDQDILNIRPWTSLLINEGSFLNVYTTYEYFHHIPPSSVPAIFPRHRNHLPHLTSLSYIAIFPTATHINRVVVPHLPKLESLYMQTTPEDLDFELLLDKSRLSHLDVRDPWMEVDSSAQAVVNPLFATHHPLSLTWSHLRRFEWRCFQEKESWKIFATRVEANNPRDRRWTVARSGVLVREVDEE